MPDEGEPLQVLLPIEPVVSVTARRLRQQAFALVETDGFRLGLGYFCEFANLHGKAFPSAKCIAQP